MVPSTTLRIDARSQGSLLNLPQVEALDTAAPISIKAPEATLLSQAQQTRGPSVITIPGLTPGTKDPLKPTVYGIGGSFPIGLGWLINKVGLNNVLRVLPPQARQMTRAQLDNLSARVGILPGLPPDALKDFRRIPKDLGIFVSISLPGYPVAYAMVINPGKGGFIGGIAKIWPVGPPGADGMPNVLLFNNSYVGFTGLGTNDFRGRTMPGYVAVLGRIPFSDTAKTALANSIRVIGTAGQVGSVAATPVSGGSSLAAAAWLQALKEITAGTIESGTYYSGVGWAATTENRDLNDWRFNIGGRLVEPKDAIPEILQQWAPDPRGHGNAGKGKVNRAGGGLTSHDPRMMTPPNARVIAGYEVHHGHVLRNSVGARVKGTDIALQGTLMKGSTRGGTSVYWLQGKENYVLFRKDGGLVGSDSEALSRAREMIKFRQATHLYPLDPKHLGKAP
jgi:hypothetical protein